MGLQEQRFRILVQPGIVPSDVEPAPLHMRHAMGSSHVREKRKSIRAMEIFAVMVDLIDLNVGQSFNTSKQRANGTTVLMSDNGVKVSFWKLS